MSADFNEIATLFAVIEGSVGHTGKFASIQAGAMNRLTEINAALRTEAMAAEQARRDEAEQAAAKEFDDSRSDETTTQADPARRF